MVKFFPPLHKINWLILGGLILFYLGWNSLIVGLRSDHIVFLVFIVLFYVLTKFTRRVFYSYSVFVLFWIIYDSLRVIPNYLFSDVHIIQPYLMEKFVFGIKVGTALLTPNEYFEIYNNKFLDFLTGLFYLSWIPVPLMFGMYLMLKRPIYLLEFSCAFLLVNFLGFILYYSYPAAPPWYFAQYGEQIQFNIPGNAANLVKFDHIIGFDLFKNLYIKNSNVFAAFPSLHAAYPVITLFYCLKYGSKWLSLGFALLMIGVWFAAVYTFHHYFIDVLLGIICATFAIFIFEKLILKSNFRLKLLNFAVFIDKENC